MIQRFCGVVGLFNNFVSKSIWFSPTYSKYVNSTILSKVMSSTPISDWSKETQTPLEQQQLWQAIETPGNGASCCETHPVDIVALSAGNVYKIRDDAAVSPEIPKSDAEVLKPPQGYTRVPVQEVDLSKQEASKAGESKPQEGIDIRYGYSTNPT